MWPFKRKKSDQVQQTGQPCPHCGSSHSSLKDMGGAQPDYIKNWRGQRYAIWRCSDCCQDFYTGAPLEGLPGEINPDDSIFQDEKALIEAEEELKRQADIEGDHRFR